jgi:hypothetical protein
VAAYPVTGPLDVVKQNITGIVDNDLQTACLGALKLNSEDCVNYARTCTWEKCAQTVVDSVATIRRLSPAHFHQDRELRLTAEAAQ